MHPWSHASRVQGQATGPQSWGTRLEQWQVQDGNSRWSGPLKRHRRGSRQDVILALRGGAAIGHRQCAGQPAPRPAAPRAYQQLCSHPMGKATHGPNGRRPRDTKPLLRADSIGDVAITNVHGVLLRTVLPPAHFELKHLFGYAHERLTWVGGLQHPKVKIL